MSAGHPTIVDATAWPPDEWDRLAVHSPLGHAFQSHAWGELKRPLGWTPRRHVIELDGDPVAVVASQRRALLPSLPGPAGRLAYLYAPRGPILLRPEPEVLRVALEGLLAVAAAERAAIVTLDPLWPADGPMTAQLAAVGFAPARRDVQVSRTAMVVPLFDDEAEQHRLVRKSTANLINRARREGATVEMVDLSTSPAPEAARALGELHDLYAATARREGMVLRDRSYQVAQWRALGEAGIATLWFARVGGRRWTGSVLLRCGETLHQFQAGSADDADLRAVPANHLLQWEIIRWASANGFRGYDLGGVDAPGARGLPRDELHPLWNLSLFKRGFGAEGVEYVRAHEWASNRIARAAWAVARRLR